MTIRLLLIATAMLGSCATASAQTTSAQSSNDTTALSDAIPGPVLRANVSVSSDVVRIGDLVDNAGSVAQVALYRAPDLGTTGTLSTAQLLTKLRAHQVIGVDTGNIQDVTITRLSRSLTSKDIEQQIARSLERRNGLGDASSLSVTFDRELRTVQLDPSNTGDPQVVSAHFDSRNGRFDVLMEIDTSNGRVPTRLRFTGTVVETAETAVLTRNVERNEVLKSSDIVVERRPKTEVGNDGARRDRTVGMQLRKALRAGQALHMADLAKPDLVQRDQMVTLIYQSDGLYLTMRAKAVDNGTDGDTVSVMNPQSKRTLQGTVTGPNQVTVSSPTPRPITTAAVNNDSTSTEPRKAE
jgi:flagella basal body P-ring formation protein FlgA